MEESKLIEHIDKEIFEEVRQDLRQVEKRIKKFGKETAPDFVTSVSASARRFDTKSFRGNAVVVPKGPSAGKVVPRYAGAFGAGKKNKPFVTTYSDNEHGMSPSDKRRKAAVLAAQLAAQKKSRKPRKAKVGPQVSASPEALVVQKMGAAE